MTYYYVSSKQPDYIMHSGTLGMKWGVRRYQNEDGSLTPEGKERYGRTMEYNKKISKAKNKSKKAYESGKTLKGDYYKKKSTLYQNSKKKLDKDLKYSKNMDDADLARVKSKMRDKVNDAYGYEEYRDKYWEEKMNKKGKSGKEGMYRYAANKNDRIRQDKLRKIDDYDSSKQITKDRAKGVLRTLSGYETLRPAKARSVNTPIERYNLHHDNFDNRLRTRFTADKTMQGMRPQDAYQYANNKRLYRRGFSNGVNR